MKNFRITVFRIILPALVTVCLASFSAARADDWNKVVDGLSVHLGVQSENMLPGALKNAQGKMTGNNNSYHLTIVLFDAASGKPVEHALVWATVGEVGMSGTRKKMERLSGKDSANYYGNIFTMLPGMGPYRIAVEIQGVENHDRVDTVFEYTP